MMKIVWRNPIRVARLRIRLVKGAWDGGDAPVTFYAVHEAGTSVEYEVISHRSTNLPRPVTEAGIATALPRPAAIVAAGFSSFCLGGGN